MSTLQGLSKIIPNLSSNEAGSRSFNTIFGMRGLTNTQYFSDPATAVYLDGIPMGRAFSRSIALYELDSVTVHRGSQATLFGQNNEAGTILMTTKAPGNTLAGSATASYGSYNAQTYIATLGGALIPDQRFLGISGYHDSRDGFIYNETRGTHPDFQSGFGGRISLRWAPSPNWEFSLISMQEFDNDGEQRISALLREDPFKVTHSVDGKTVVNTNITGLKTQYTGENIEITSISAFNFWRLDPYLVNFGFAPNPEILEEINFADRVWSQELRISNLADRKTAISWSGGLFFSHEVIEVDLIGKIPLFSLIQTGKNHIEENSYAVFGNVTIPLSKSSRISLGSRVDYRQKSAYSDAYDFSNNRVEEEARRSFLNVVPEIGVVHDLNESTELYANSSLPFKAGGFVPFQGASQLSRYDTEQAWTSDIGIKKALLNRKLSLDASFFYSAVTDYQFERYTSPTDYRVINIPKVNIYGGEFEILTRPLAGLELGIGLSYSKATIKDHIDPADTANRAGNRVPYVPEYKLVGHLQYQHQSGFMGRIDAQFVSDVFYDENNSPFTRQAPYLVFNSKIGYNGKHYGVFLFARNLSDARYYTFKSGTLGAGTISDPRTFGVEGRIAF